ncbi:hypothetical protein THAOC_32255 [Thalassiosira oceanica]|uniref:cGMP-dependent protein kinase n=1 Tax=Thalassiosira oceanica TaxID=159749 RepID=K0RIZ7_THAOC|nr:hypothetical protein THAOC_32255 [Thalassiosira oceanica]|eukprot:EJK48911.1 hypothetical protein THAOC_32255 [Thalassiosira oceanica]
MQNIHSSPFQPQTAFEAPVFPKSDEDVEFVSLALQRNFVFANALSDEETSRKREMKSVVDAFEVHRVASAGTKISSRDLVGDYFYILKSGCVDYMGVDPATGSYGIVGRARRPGQSFGELCLLYDCFPPADCVSGDPRDGKKVPADGSSCVLWRMHKQTFRQIMAHRTMRRDVALRNALLRIRQFDGLDSEFIARIANALDVRTVGEGDTIYREGDPASEFFVVGGDGSTVELSGGGRPPTALGHGDAFGSSVISSPDGRRAETAVARTRSTLLVMDREHLDRTIGSLADALTLSNDRRLLKSLPLFRDSDFEDYEYELLAALIDRKELRGGTVVYEEQTMVEEPALYIVRDGLIDLICDEKPEREKVLREGDFFGEDTLTPDKNMKFGGPKGGTKYYQESIEVVSDTATVGMLTLSNIESVVLDLHRLVAPRAKSGGGRKRGLVKSRSASLEEDVNVHGLDDLNLLKLFGAGTFGRVWIVTSKGGGKTPYALKIQSKRKLLDKRQASSAKREREVMAKLDHPFVCHLVGTFQDAASIYMVMSLIQGGELLNLIQGGGAYGGLPEIATKFYSAGILEGLTYMHRRHIVYRDLKPENVLLDSDGYPVIVDFGFCECLPSSSIGLIGGIPRTNPPPLPFSVVTDKTYTFCGTPLYLAPEIILSRGHDRGVDYWALGCLLYEMLFSRTPFFTDRVTDQKSLFKNIVRGKWNVPNDKLTDAGMDILRGMLTKRPADRLGCLAGGYRDVKQHLFFRQVNFTKLVKRQIKAPWRPEIVDPLDISHFESFVDRDDKGMKDMEPLTEDEQLVFRDF